MYYVFSNSTKLVELANQKKWEELMSEFKNSQLIIPENYKGLCPSAREVYRKICEMLLDEGKEELLICGEYVSKIFADCWAVDALSMMAESESKYGKMHEDAVEVLEEYKYCKALAMDEFQANKDKKCFEKEVKGIKITFKSGKLCFVRNGIEYKVFRSEGVY